MSGARRPALHVVLLAGGSGTRFWPLSRAARPKQLLPLTGGEPLLRETWKRVRRLAAAERIWVVTPRGLRAQVRRILPELDAARLVVEPSPRDTAPAIALACARIAAQDPEAIAAVFPTDHVIGDTRAFVAAVRVAARAAADDALVCMGIRPDRPATGFGYLRCGAVPRTGRAIPVERFVEKPDAARARRFVRSGRYLWNGGMFVWRVTRFLDELERTAPQVRRAVERHLAGRPGAWARAPRRSVDYAVMERASGVMLVPLDAAWDDVGSWDAAARLRGRRRAKEPQVIRLDSPDSAVFGEGRLVALVGVPEVVVVDTPDALLVVARDRAESVKEIVAELKRRRRDALL